ncbi:MAG: hypothetical protein WKG00_13370 [Polyangiaceae bacterium]
MARRAAVLLAACVTASSALLAHPSMALAGGVSPITASPQDRKRAQARYEEGTKLYEAHRYADAQKAFQESYDIVASPNSHLMMARSMREQNQLVLAYEELERVENEARQLASADPAKYSGTVDKAIIDREALRKRVGLVTVRARGEVSVTVAGHAVPADRLTRPVAVTPGRVEIVGTSGDGRRATRFVNVGAGSAQDVDLDVSAQPLAAPAPTAGAAEPPPDLPATRDDGNERRTSLIPFAVISGGLGVIALGVGIGFGVAQDPIYEDLVIQCAKDKKLCDENERQRGQSWQTTANVSFGVAGGLGALTAALVAIELARTPSSDERTGRLPAPRLSVGWQHVGVSGAF